MPNLHVMLDIETLGKAPGCCIMSIAARTFDPYGDDTLDAILDSVSFSINCDLTAQLLDGFHIDDETLAWWRNQSKETKAALYGNEGSLEASLYAFADFLEKKAKGPSPAPWGSINIWAKSPDFDCAILEHAMNFYGIKVPWTFRDKRDVRTITAVASGIPGGAPFVSATPPQAPAHVASNDCITQINAVKAAIRNMRKPANG